MLCQIKLVFDGKGGGKHNQHFSKCNGFLLTRDRVRLHDTERGPRAKCAINDIYSQNNWVPLGEHGDNLQPTWPNRLWGGIFTLRLDDFGIIRSEGVEQMIDDIRYSKMARSIELLSGQRCEKHTFEQFNPQFLRNSLSIFVDWYIKA